MMKRIMSLLLAFLMVVSLMPMSIFAEGGEETVCNCTPVDGVHAEDCPLYVDSDPVDDGEEEEQPVCNCTPVDGVHDETCPVYTAGEDEEPALDFSGDVYKYVKLSGAYSTVAVYDANEDLYVYDNADFIEGSIMQITDWRVQEDTFGLLYRVEFYSGGIVEEYAAGWPAEAWILQRYLDVEGEEDSLVFVSCCSTCGEPDCAITHFWCEICQMANCDKPHLYCPVCENKVDCTENHVFCGICNKYDCGIEHVNKYKPISAPVIPETPTLTPGQVVSIADGAGNSVGAAGITLYAGEQISLSAWSDLSGAYQWQIRYDAAEDLWANIQGQTGKGILVTPAMVASVINASGSAAIRCLVTDGENSYASAAIPVSIGVRAQADSEEPASGASASAGSDEGLQTVYVVVTYEYSDGRTAASSDFAQLVPGKAYSHSYPLPIIPGYMATLETNSLGDYVGIQDNNLVMNIPENVLTEAYTVFTVKYVPDFVNYTVIHYWQNVDNDYYSEHERESIDNKYKTGEQVAVAHKSYPGLYNLLYETPTAAADGSTVVEVYYDRYYYLMKFDLGDMGYGVDPVYARYGDTLEIGTPTRPGYTFMGWTLNGVDAEIPATVPAENRTYTAKWQAVDETTVNIVIWGENPDDEGYSYIKTEQITAKPGDVINYESLKYDCGYVAHTHSSSCGYDCGYVDHEHSAACYSCGQAEHSHGRACYTVSGGTLSNDAETDETWLQRLNDADPYDDDGQIYRARSNNSSNYRYYLKIGNSYYRIEFRGQSINNFTYSLSCGNTEHTHGSGCGYICGLPEHSHAANCYACGMTEHIHTAQCEADIASMDTNLWTYVKSDTVTVDAAGTSVINVYYDRVSFTIDFYEGNRNNANNRVYTINAKWGADISAHWPIPGYTEGERWQPHDSSTYSAVLVFIAIMPQESFDLVVDDTSYDPYDMHYMLEVLPGESGTSYTYNSVTKYFDNEFSISAQYNYVTEDEDFFPLEGFDKWISNPRFASDGKIENGSSGTDVYFYYARHLYAIEFYNPTELLKKETGVAYEMELGSYDFTPTAEQAPAIYEPGSVNFGGWYLNPECTGDEYVLAEHTMPSANNNGDTSLVLYAKWEPVEYKVNYFIDRDSMEVGETIPEEMDRLVNEAIAAGKLDAAPAVDPYSVVYAEDIVKHGGFLGNLGDPDVAEGYENVHPYTGYEFIGWFYLNDAGEETAFDPDNIPVHQDLELYGKWSANKICRYTIHFALDLNNDGQPDTDADGNIIYIADSLTGSGIAGHTYTFTAKGGDELYEAYDEGYFPTVGSHSINIDIADEDGTGANSYTFLYKEKTVAPYTVYYKDKATGEDLIDPKVVAGNKNIIVTENFVAIPKYMPDEYQKTLVITADGQNEIIFWYTEDEIHALYVVNHYIQNLDSNLVHSGWTKYTSLQNTGLIGTEYTAEAITIDGFTLDNYYTSLYNNDAEINGMTGMPLPTLVGELTADGKISGTLSENGMELNFYYTRNLYPYEFRYMLNGTTIVLADPEFGKAAYDSTVIEAAKEIVADLDGDGINEDYRLYDPTETTKSIHINKDGEALGDDDVVTAGQAKVNVATFYYIRCTQTMSVTKVVQDLGTYSDPDPDKQFTISLLIHSKDGYHQSSYPCRLSDGTNGILYPVPSAPNTLQFTLKAGQTITIEGLPTAEYTISELNLPDSYYIDKYEPAQKNKLTVDSQLDISVINTYDPATLEISKTVDVVENDSNIPEVEYFRFTVTVPSGVTGEYTYIVGGETRTVEVDDGKMVLSLKNGETALFVDLPRGVYTVEEDNYSAYGYNSYVSLNSADHIESRFTATELARSDDDTVNFKNMYPVGDLWIEKTVTKEFYGTVWTGDSFTFTVERTTKDRPLIAGNSYDVYEDGTKIGTATVDADGKLQLEIVFNADDAAKLDEAAEQGNKVIRTYVIKNVPAGEYSVTEATDTDYNQSDLSISGLVIPAETAPVAEFANELIRPDGSLYLEKELVPAEGFNPSELPTDTVFSFTVELTELPPEGTTEITVSKNGGTATAAAMVDGKFTVELMAGENVIINGLPIGSYRITEATIPYYANSFAHKVNGAWVPQATTAFDDGRLYTDIAVLKDERSDVKCTNTYPVDTAELVIQKLVTKAYDRDTLPEDTFIFTVTLDEEDRDSYSYKIYNQDGTVAVNNGTAVVTNNTFSVPLMDGQYAVIEDMPVCGYTISENASAVDYSASYKVYLSECESDPSKAVDTTGELNGSGEGFSFRRTFTAGKVETVVFTNEYRRHLGTLTITKTANGGNVDDTFVFHIKGKDESNSYIDMDVTIEGSGSVTIYEMPLGSYTVTEDSSWSWRWICTSDLSGTEVISVDDLHAEIAFENSFDENRWLNGTDCEMNIFSKKEND